MRSARVDTLINQRRHSPPWQVISPAEVTGRVAVVPHLSEVQDEVYQEPTVLVVENVTGGRPRAA